MLRKLLKITLIVLPLTVLVSIACNKAIVSSSESKVFSNVEEIPARRVGLVLGTARKLKNGNTNLYFKYRVEAAVELYKSKKVEYILVSGDNSRETYDEPSDFQEALVKRGIPKHKIYLDYAGFRTLDSVVRAKKVFGLTSVTIISQRFHNERAIFLAEGNGISAIGFNAKDVQGRSGLKTKLREYFARTKAVIDLLLHVEPKSDNLLGKVKKGSWVLSAVPNKEDGNVYGIVEYERDGCTLYVGGWVEPW